MNHTINFINLFDWQKESDIHYYHLLTGRQLDREEYLAASIEVVHDKTQEYENYDEIDKGTLPGVDEEGL